MRLFVLSLILLLLFAFILPLRPASSGPNPEAQRAQKALDHLITKIPDFIRQTWVKPLALFIEIDKAKTTLKSMRWIGNAEVKITYLCSFPDPKDTPQLSSPVIVSFHLRFYADRWTAIGFWASHPGVPGATLMTLIDDASPKQ